MFLKVPIPRFAVGIVIGRNGEMIKKIQNDAGVRIQFKPGGSHICTKQTFQLCWLIFKNILFKYSISLPDDGTTPDRIAQITGPPDRCQHAAEIITDLLRSVQVSCKKGYFQFI